MIFWLFSIWIIPPPLHQLLYWIWPPKGDSATPLIITEKVFSSLIFFSPLNLQLSFHPFLILNTSTKYETKILPPGDKPLSPFAVYTFRSFLVQEYRLKNKTKPKIEWQYKFHFIDSRKNSLYLCRSTDMSSVPCLLFYYLSNLHV